MRSITSAALGAFLGVALAGIAFSLRAESPGGGGGVDIGGILEEALRRELTSVEYTDFEGIRVPIFDESGRRTGTTYIDDRGVTVTDRDGNVINKFDDEGSIHHKPEVFREIVLPQTDGGAVVIGTEGMKFLSDRESGEYLWSLGVGGFCQPLRASLEGVSRFCLDYMLVDGYDDNGSSSSSGYRGGSGSGLPWEGGRLDSGAGSSYGGGLTIRDKIGRTALFQDDDRIVVGGYLFSQGNWGGAADASTRDSDGIQLRGRYYQGFRWQQITPSIQFSGVNEFDLDASLYREIPQSREDCIPSGDGGEFCLKAGVLWKTDALGLRLDYEFNESLLGDNCTRTDWDTDVCFGGVSLSVSF